jgi:hypothetical protein
MLTLRELEAEPGRISELDGADVLIASAGSAEVVVRRVGRQREATIVFMHETISMMRAGRAEELTKLRQEVSEESPVVPLRKRPESLWDHITVGRASTADILIEDPAISNVHAHFEVDPDGGTVSLMDVGSSNGTFVNTQQLQPHETTVLKPGDCVRFGQSIFYYVSNDALQEMLESE